MFIEPCSYSIIEGRKGGNKMSSESCENVHHKGNGSGFELIVVLFILLIIVGAAFVGNSYDSGCDCY